MLAMAPGRIKNKQAERMRGLVQAARESSRWFHVGKKTELVYINPKLLSISARRNTWTQACR